MRVKITAKVGNRREFDRKIDNIKKVSKNSLEVIGKQQVAAVQRRITTTKMDADGRPWVPWALSTLRQRIRDGSAGRGLLWKTGALLASIKYTIKVKTVQIFSSVNYAQYLQHGTNRMPARPFIGFGEQDQQEIHMIIKEQLNK